MKSLNPDSNDKNRGSTKGLGAFFGALTEVILTYRLVSAGILGLIVLAVTAGIAFFQLDFNAKLFYGTNDPERVYLEEYLGYWGADDLMVMVVDGGEETLLTQARLSQLERVREAVEAHPEVGETRTLADHKRPKMSFFGVQSVPLIDTMPADPTSLEAWRVSVLADEALVPSLISADGRVASLVLTPTIDTDDMAANNRLLGDLNDLLVQFEGVEGLSYSLAGIPSLRGAVVDAIIADQLILVPVAGGLMAVLLVLMFRSRHGVLVPLLACVVPLIMLLGGMGYLEQSLGLLNQTYLVLIPAIAVADAIHLVSRYHEETRAVTEPGQPHSATSQRTAIVTAMRHMGLACMFTSITTIIGFLSLGFTQMTVLRDYGFFAALGIFFAYFTVLLIVPLALSKSRRAAPLSSQDDKGWLGKLLTVCADLAYRHPRNSLFVTALAMCVALFFGTWVKVDTRFSDVLAEDNSVSHANLMLDAHLGGVVGLEFDIQGPKGALAKPENLDKLAELEDALKQGDNVRTVFGPAFLVSMLNEQTVGKRARPGEQRDVEGLYRLADLDAGRATLVSRDRDRGRVAVRMQDAGGAEFLESAAAMNQLAQDAVSDTDLTAHLTGTTFVSYRGVNRVTSDLRNSLMGAFVVIALLICVLFRSVRFGLISLIPNTIPLVLAYGAMGVMGWRLDAAPAVVFTVALGLGVDSTIHVLARFNEERKAGRNAAIGVHRSVMHSGRAIAITSVILAVGFGVNAFSSFPDNAIFGVLGALIVMGAFLANLIVLPSLLSLAFGGDALSEKKSA